MNIETLRREYTLPIAIVFAGLLIALAVYAVRTKPDALSSRTGSPDHVTPVHPGDRIFGNPDAPVKLIEYADIDSPHSKQFHLALEQVMSEFGAGGKVAWVYRHFPLLDRSTASAAHAEAAECAGYVGGDDTFWHFITALQSAAPGENQFRVDSYMPVAKQLGIAEDAFTSCLEQGRFTKKVYDDSSNALDAGAEGAPYTILLIEGKPPVGIQGALSYEDLKRVVTEAIAQVQ